MIAHRRGKRGFTLVELLVVIGIIALLIGILLPTLGRVRKSGNLAKCAATMRNLGQAMFSYSADFGGSLPFGLYTSNNAPSSGLVNDGGDNPADENVFVWWSVLRKYVLPGVPNLGYDNRVPSQDARVMKVFACPEGFNVDAGCDFGVNPSLMPDQRREIISFANRPFQLLKSGSMKQLSADVILMWDATEIPPDFNAQYVTGYQVDNAQFGDSAFLTTGANARARFRGFVNQNSGLADSRPIDPGTNLNADEPRQAGSIRWRHGREDTANFLWGDGSVRPGKRERASPGLNATFNPNGGSDILRRNLRPKPPAGWKPL